MMSILTSTSFDPYYLSFSLFSPSSFSFSSFSSFVFLLLLILLLLLLLLLLLFLLLLLLLLLLEPADIFLPCREAAPLAAPESRGPLKGYCFGRRACFSVRICVCSISVFSRSYGHASTSGYHAQKRACVYIASFHRVEIIPF